MRCTHSNEVLKVNETLKTAALRAAACTVFTALICTPSWAAQPAAHPATTDTHLDVRLDLRPPLSLPAEGAEKAAAFPSGIHQRSFGDLWAGASLDRPANSAASSASTNPRTPSRIEELAMRVHRDGIPLARLWENKSALVSLGLNGRGKPGIWLTQKIH